MNGLEHFKRSEFNYPDEIDVEFLKFLDAVRHHANIPFRLTSDGRTPEQNTTIGGYKYSLHLFDPRKDHKCSAVDWSTPGIRKRDAQRYYAEIAAVATAVVQVGLHEDRYWQLEVVKSSRDWHFHLGLFRSDYPGPNKFIVTTD